MLEHAVKDVSVEWVRHEVLGELFEYVSLAEWGSIGLSIVLNGMVPPNASDTMVRPTLPHSANESFLKSSPRTP